jgi:hypothetical protein
MRSVLGWILRLYLGIGLVLGGMLFASQTMQSAMAAPETDELVHETMVAAVKGSLRVLYWAPSIYEQVVVRNADPVNWAIN